MRINGHEIKPGADLQGADLHSADLVRANLRGANLRGANLRGANLLGATLHGADLVRANLHSADLHSADLTDANLTGANLTDANLRYASLRYAILNWQSHELVAEILRQSANKELAWQLKIAGMVLVAKHWCWEDFDRELQPLEKAFARDALRPWFENDDKAPALLKNYEE